MSILRFRPIIRRGGQLAVTLLVLTSLTIFLNEFAVARSSRRFKNIPYVADQNERHRLDVYAPKHRSGPASPVVLFIHGGNWTNGSKNLYTFIGRRLAKQGIVAVVINYRLAPAVQVPAMADDGARAVTWTYQHIAEYGGDPDRIFVMGHSAGGGLAALLAVDDRLFTRLGMTRNPVRGAILDDPAGLDMADYLTKMAYPGDEQYLVPFGKDPAIWRSVSAMYHLTAQSPPMLLYVGERTYPSIVSSSRLFTERLRALGIRYTYTIMPGKKHVAMVTQLFFSGNTIYEGVRRLVDEKNEVCTEATGKLRPVRSSASRPQAGVTPK